MLCALAGALVAAAAPVQPAASPAHSAARTPVAVERAATDTTVRFRFDIPAQSLQGALDAFARQAGLRVELSGVASPDVRSSVVTGSLTAPAALRRLLAGTGYQALFRDTELVVVTPADAADAADAAGQRLAPVRVAGEAARTAGYGVRRTSSATRTSTPLRDVPQAVTVVGRELLADQSMQSMADVVRYIPGITMGQGEGHRDAPTIRGNSSTADFFVDGVRDDVQYFRDVYNVERVEALKGSNAMVFGRGGGGGVLNRVTKDARFTPTRALTLEGGSFDHRRATADVGEALGTGVAVRLNALLERSGTFRDANELEREGINPTAAVLLGGTLVRVGYEYFADRRTVDRGLPSFQGRPSDGDITTFFGDPDASRSRAVVHAAGATIERGSEDGLLLRNRTRVASYDKFYQNVFPGAVNAAGTQVSLAAYSNETLRRNLFNQTDLTYAVATGPVRQTLLLGAELGRQTTSNYRRTGYFNETATSLDVPLDQPTLRAPVTFRQSASDADNESTADVVSVYAQDQLALGDHWQAIAGVRYERFALDFLNERNGQRLERTDDMISPRAGLVFKPVQPLSAYGTYSVSFLPSSGDQFSSLTVTSQALEPERFTNRELGLKWDVRPDLALTAAAYRLDRSNSTAPDPADPQSRVVQTGRQRTTGVELGITGYVTGAWQLAGGYVNQRATIVSQTTSAAAGARVPLVPRQTLSLWNRYQFTGRLAAGLGVVHQASMFAAIDNSVTLPAFTRVDGAAFVTLRRGLRAQVNVENLLDARYYGTSHGNNNIMPGAPRSIRVSLAVTP
jgi:catecholate siderophore receptor